MKYSETPIFNLTSLLKNAVETNNQNLLNIFKDVNFNEVSNIHIVINNDFSNSYSINESLAENILARLPINYYKQFISEDWIYIENNSDSILEIAFRNNKYDFVLYFSNFLFDSLKSNYNEEIYYYLNRNLNKFFDIDIVNNKLHNLSIKEESLSLNYIDFNKHMFKLYCDFHNTYRNSKVRYSDNLSLLEIVNNLNHSNKTLFNIFDSLIKENKIFNIYSIEKDKFSELSNPDNLYKAVEHDNLSVVNHIMKNNNLNVVVYSKILKNSLNYMLKSDLKSKEHFDILNKINDKINLHTNNVLNNYSNSNDFLIAINKYLILVEEISLNPNEESIFDFFSNKEVYLAHKIITEYSNKYNIDVKNNFQYCISEKVFNNLTTVDYNDIDYSNSLKFIKDKFKQQISNIKENPPFESFFTNKILEYTIPQKDLKLKKQKI